MASRVVVVRCSDYRDKEVYTAVSRAVDLLGGTGRFIKPGQRVLIKPNLLSAKPPELAVTTHPMVVKATIELVKKAGGIPFIGDSPAMGSLYRVAEGSGILRVVQETGAGLEPFDESVEVSPLPGSTFKKVEVARKSLEADVIINLPKIKTHSGMLLTLSVKNLFGCVVGRKKAQWHLMAGVDRDSFATMLVELYQLLRPSLTIVDGVVGMEGDGPGSGDPRQLGLILAGSDCVAIDRVICEVLGINAGELPTNRAAKKKAAGETDLSNIEILGEALERVKVHGFRLPHLVDLEGVRPFLKGFLKEALTAKPLEDRQKCTLCLLCAGACPPEVIFPEDGRLRFDYDRCIRCFCCLEVCPEGAIEIRQGWLLRLREALSGGLIKGR